MGVINQLLDLLEQPVSEPDAYRYRCADCGLAAESTDDPCPDCGGPVEYVDVPTEYRYMGPFY